MSRQLLLPTVAQVKLSGDIYPEIFRSIDSDSGFMFQVVSNKRAGVGYALDALARGRPLKTLTPQEEALVFPAIYKKESKILLGQGANGSIVFEPDRHKGNYLVDLSGHPPIVYVIDYGVVPRLVEIG